MREELSNRYNQLRQERITAEILELSAGWNKSMNQGTIDQIIGSVVDVRFPKDQLPDLYNKLIVQVKRVSLEVAQHIGHDIVRCISMQPTDGLQRGMKALDTGNQSVYQWVKNVR